MSIIYGIKSQKEKNKMDSLNIQYRSIIDNIKIFGVRIINKRTNTAVIQYIEHPVIIYTLLNEAFPLLTNRKYYLNVAAAETAWQLMGTQDLSFINKYAPKLWSKFDDSVDDKYAEYPYILNAQGFRWQHYFSRNQILEAIKCINMDKSNRQILISSWDPNYDGLLTKSRNTHCLPFFNLRPCPKTNFLHMTVFSRSADMIVGFPYDLYNYSFLLYAFAKSTNLYPGYLSLVLNNYHIYDIPSHRAIMNNIIAGKFICNPGISKFPPFSIDDIIKTPEKYIEWVQYNMKYEHEYKPKVDLVV